MLNDHEALERAERSLESLARRQRYDERNRLLLLSIHGWMGLMVGVGMIVSGPPPIWGKLVGPHVDFVINVPPMLGGVVLLGGLYAGRRLWAEAVGMALLLSWDIGMTVLLSANAIATKQSSYAVAVYLGLALLMTTHLVTLVRYMKRSRDRGDR